MPLMFDDLPKGDQGAQPLMFDDLLAGKQEAPVTASGLAKAAGAGAVSGVVDLPGDVISLINLARKGYTRVTGGTYDPASDDYSLGQGYEHVRQAADQLYEPQNSAEGWAKTAGEFLPAVVTGPEGLAGKGGLEIAGILARRAVRQAAVPAAASEAAGAVTKGTELEPYARVGAGLIAGGLGARGAKPEPITAADVGKQAATDFSDFRSAPVTIKPGVVEAAARSIQNDLTASGLSKAPAHDLVAPYIGNPTPVSLSQLQETRTLLGKAAKMSDTPEGVAAIRAKQGIDALMSSLTPADTVVGANALPHALEALKQGRTNAAVEHQLEAIEGAQYRGEMNASASGGDAAQALRQQVNAVLKSQRAMNRLQAFRPDLEQVVQGTSGLNALRKAASLTGGVGGWHSGPWWLGALLAEPFSGTASASMAAMPFAGMALKKLETKLTQNKLDALRAKIATNAQGLPPLPVPNSTWPTRVLTGTLAANNGQ